MHSNAMGSSHPVGPGFGNGNHRGNGYGRSLLFLLSTSMSLTEPRSGRSSWPTEQLRGRLQCLFLPAPRLQQPSQLQHGSLGRPRPALRRPGVRWYAHAARQLSECYCQWQSHELWGLLPTHLICFNIGLWCRREWLGSTQLRLLGCQRHRRLSLWSVQPSVFAQQSTNINCRRRQHWLRGYCQHCVRQLHLRLSSCICHSEHDVRRQVSQA